MIRIDSTTEPIPKTDDACNLKNHGCTSRGLVPGTDHGIYGDGDRQDDRICLLAAVNLVVSEDRLLFTKLHQNVAFTGAWCGLMSWLASSMTLLAVSVACVALYPEVFEQFLGI